MESIEINVVKPIRRFSKRVSSILDENKTELYPSVIYHNILFFNISYYTCVTPFCIKSSARGIFKIHTNKLQQVITGILHLLTIAFVLRWPIIFLGTYSQKSIIKNPELLIRITNVFLQAPYLITAIYIFWRRKHVLEKLWNVSQNDYTEKKRNVRTLIVNICVVFLILLLTLGSIFMEEHSFSLENWILVGIKHAIHELSLKSHFPTLEMKAENSTIHDFSRAFIALGIFERIFTIYCYLFKTFCILIILISAIQVYHSCKGFSNALNSGEQDILKVLQHYVNVRYVTNTINEFIGKLLPIFVIALLFNCIDLPRVIVGRGIGRWKVFCVISVCVAIFSIAADAHRKISFLKEWLFQYKINGQSRKAKITTKLMRKQEDIYEILKWDCDTSTIGLGSQLFTLTYGFFALLLSVGTSYGAIQLQFYNSAIKSEESFSIFQN